MTIEQLKEAMWRMLGYGAKDYHGCARKEIQQVEAQLSVHTTETMTAQELANRVRNGEKWKVAETEQPSLSDKLALAAKHVLNHWNEFGPECGFDESMEMLSRALLAQGQDSDKDAERLIRRAREFYLGRIGATIEQCDSARSVDLAWLLPILAEPDKQSAAAIANGAPK